MSLAFLHVVSGTVGYVVLAALVGGESLGLPLPGETALITAGVLAHDGRFSIPVVIAVAALAAIVGDNVGYVLGRFGGRRLIERPGPFEDRRRAFLAKGQPFFDRHGGKAVFLGRWVTGVRIAAAWLAGMNRMPWPTFLMYNALGGIAWAASVGLAAYLVGPAVARVIKDAGIAGVVVVVVGAVVVWLVHRRRRRVVG